MRFRDRTDAGRQLAARLMNFKDQDPIVLGLPRGGVVLAYEVAEALEAPLDIIVARKLGAPMNPEFGIGAIAPGGIRVLDSRAVAISGATMADIEEITAQEEIEMDRRLRRYRGDLPALHVTGRTVLLVDDGLATGVTARAAVRALKLQKPSRLVLAVPVAAPDTLESMQAEVDNLICLYAPPNFAAVGQFYENFGQTSDDEVLGLLDRARRGGASGRGAGGR